MQWHHMAIDNANVAGVVSVDKCKCETHWGGGAGCGANGAEQTGGGGFAQH